MRAIITLFFIGMSSVMLAQNVPLIQVGEEELGVKKLDVTVELVGNMMTTTYDMYFYNPTSEILEGELTFPLDQGQSVSRFALDVNGVLREAVVVEKEQGRVAFEAVVRSMVDPALLEKGTGNNYNARIYPIPPNDFKRVLLAYDQEIPVDGEQLDLRVPLNFKNKMDRFSMKVVVDGTEVKPKLASGGKIRGSFDKQQGQYVMNFSASDFRATSDFLVEVPIKNKAAITRFDEYIYGLAVVPEASMERRKPEKVKLLWDVSYSMMARDLEKEFDLLRAYFKAVPDVDVQVVTFSDRMINYKTFEIKEGNWAGLRLMLEEVIYDGATSFDALFQNNDRYDEILLFTDGMNTLSDFPSKSKTPVFVINSIQKANHDQMNSFGQDMAGAYVNLNSQDPKEALEMIRYSPLRLLNVKSAKPDIEVYPAIGTPVYGTFTYAVKGTQAGQQLEFEFGYDNEVSFGHQVTVPAESGSNKIEGIWARKKIDHLSRAGERYRAEIVELAMANNLITDYTSLIVLETIRDYERYGIEPPADMIAEQKSLQIKEKVNSLPAVVENTVTAEDEEEETEISGDSNRRTGSEVTVTGKVIDRQGDPVPGVNIIESGTSNGTQTDFDGNFSIEAKTGGELNFSYIGFLSVAASVSGSSNMTIVLEESENALEEVVVTAFGITRQRQALGYAVSTLESNSIQDRPQSDLVQRLNGKIPGVQITGTAGSVGAATKFTIRGQSSISGDNSPLFVVDGIPINGGASAGSPDFLSGGTVLSNRILDIDPNNIEKVSVLRGLSASVLYGSLGRNGVVLITTKNGSFEPRASSNYFVRVEAERAQQYERRRALAKQKTIREMGFTTPYLEVLQAGLGEEDTYMLYLDMRDDYADQPAFFVDVYDFFQNANSPLADRILSNIIEMDSDNYELLRAYAYKLEEDGNFKRAAFIYRQVLKLRSEDAQSYRDLALALAEIGEYNEAIDLLSKVLDPTFYEGTHRREFYQIKPIIQRELAYLLQRKKNAIEQSPAIEDLLSSMKPLDIRVVVDWNHNDTDIDLYIVDPYLEECYYKNPTTKMGATLSEDMTDGFGPESYTLENAVKGSYYVKVDYFGDNYQKVSNPTFMKVSVFQNYGKQGETRKIKVIRLAEDAEEKLVERIALI